MPSNSTRYETLVELISAHNSDECLTWPFSMDAEGYGRVWYKGNTVTACRLVFFLTHGRWPTPLTRHTCQSHNPSCINPRHITEGSHAENVADTIRSGRFHVARGANNRNAKLTEAMVRQIRIEIATSSQRVLAAKYGVSRRYIGTIVARKRWKHIS
jgi:hypothetical protein